VLPLVLALFKFLIVFIVPLCLFGVNSFLDYVCEQFTGFDIVGKDRLGALEKRKSIVI
jgi:hypothetical protein